MARITPIDRLRLEPPRRELRAGEALRPLRWMLADATPGAEAAITSMVRSLVPYVETVAIAREGSTALARIRAFRPDLLILDLELPRIDGLSLLRALGPDRPPAILALAPSSTEGGRAAWEALALGAHDLLPRRWCGDAPRWRATLRRCLRGVSSLAEPAPGVRVRIRRLPPDGLSRLDALVFVIPMAELPAAARALRRLPGARSLPVLFVTPHPQRYARPLREGLDRLLPGPVRVAAGAERLASGVLLVQTHPGLHLEPRDGGLCLRWNETHRSLHPVGDTRGTILRSLDCVEGSRVGVVLSAPPPSCARLWADRAVESGRLFRLRTAHTGHGRLVQITRILLHPVSQAA